MKKQLASLLIASSLVFPGCSNENKDINNREPISVRNNDIQRLNVYEIPAGNYCIIEIDTKVQACLVYDNKNNININEGRLFIEKIDHDSCLNKDLEFKIEKLKETEVEDIFIKKSYGLEPGEYRFWINNSGFKAPLKTFKSKYHIQLTPVNIMNNNNIDDSVPVPIKPNSLELFSNKEDPLI